MNNIKTVEVIKPIYGLEIGDRSTRANNNDRFAFRTGISSSDHSFEGYLEITDKLIDEEYFKVIDSFIVVLSDRDVYIDGMDARIKKLIDGNKILMNEYDRLAKRHDEIVYRIHGKLNEFKEKLGDTRSEIENETHSGEKLSQLCEAEAVYYNMIDLLEKLVA